MSPLQAGAQSIYIRSREECDEIRMDNGESIRELLGRENGKAEDHSVAYVEIPKGSSSQAHLHPEAEESYFVLAGEGRLVINGVTKTVKVGDLANIRVGNVHQIFNDQSETLKFLCVCAPAWIPECFKPAEMPGASSEGADGQTIYTQKIEEGHAVQQLVGEDHGETSRHSMAYVEIDGGTASRKHDDPDAEESYYILEGQGRLVIDGEEKIVKTGEIAYLAGKVHQIFNDATEQLRLLAISASTRTPECVA